MPQRAVEEPADRRFVTRTFGDVFESSARSKGFPVLRPRQRHEPDGAASDAVLDVAHALVQHAFSISLTVASCVHLVDDAAASKLHATIDDLDELIRRIRRFAFGHDDADEREAHTGGGGEDASSLRRDQLESEVHGIAASLSASVRRLDALIRSDLLGDVRSSRLLESVDRIHDAASSLASELAVLLGLLNPDEGTTGVLPAQ